MIWLSLLHRIYVNWMCRIFFFRALWAALWRERCCTYPFVRIGSNCVWLWVCSTVAEIKTSLVSTNGSDWLVRFRVWRANVLSPNGSVFSPNELNVFNFKAALISHLAESEPQNWVISTDGALLKRRLPPEKVFEVIKRTHQATIKIINVYTVHTHTHRHTNVPQMKWKRASLSSARYYYATFAFRIMTFRFICTDLVVQQSAVTCSRTTLANKFINVALNAYTHTRAARSSWLHPVGWLTHADFALTVK